MILQKKQYSKPLNKRYKKLNAALLGNQSGLAPRIATTKENRPIHISLLTIDTVSHTDFPSAVDVTFLSALTNVDSATIEFEGKTKLSKKFTRSLTSCLLPLSEAKGPSPSESKHLCHTDGKNKGESTDRSRLQSVGNSIKLNNTFDGISKILGAGIDMYHYKLCLNSNCSSISQTTLSKLELSCIVVQLLHKIQSFKGGEKSNFNIKNLFNIVGALVVLNSNIYYISGCELKQCGLIGEFKHSVLGSNKDTKASSLKSLLGIKVDKTLLLNTKTIKPSITFFNYLNTTIRVMNDFKKVFRQLVNTLLISSLHKTNEKYPRL